MTNENGNGARSDYNPNLRDGVEVEPCIGLIELSSVPRGVECADRVLKEAQVELLFSTPVQPGKYVLLFTGSVEDCRSALRAGAEVAREARVDELLIPQVHSQVPAALRRRGGTIEGQLDAIGVVETRTVAAAIQAADIALKAATVDLIDLRIANGLGGKSFLVVTGEVSDVRSSVAAGADSAQGSGQLLDRTVIAQPHRELSRHL
ncbi:MAG: BMC domain-containing protein [Planctomycetota bacterium]|jgi:microcompartment protein CcmL/EutN